MGLERRYRRAGAAAVGAAQDGNDEVSGVHGKFPDKLLF
jgi:hypothetical protein